MNNVKLTKSELFIFKMMDLLLKSSKLLSRYKIFPRYVYHSIKKIKDKNIMRWLDKAFKSSTSTVKQYQGKSKVNKIWICWLQGEDNAPDIVKKCIENIRVHNSEKFEIYIITWDNYKEYVKIPKHIHIKTEQGLISKTHFSDILRFALLAEHGGLWIDSTYLTLKPLPDYINEASFFTLAGNSENTNEFVPAGRWSGNFLKFPKNSEYAAFIRDMFYDYWKENDTLIDYFLIDYLILLTYVSFEQFQREIDDLPKFGENSFLMSKIIFNKLNEIDDLKIEKDKIKIFKMSYKNIEHFIHRSEGTYYEKYIK
ncbi:capsular biosynthesis protein [Escherichia coli]|nr:capsular polysaccharide synthesis protein [Escherichia coli]MED8673047.1 capsular polysaccharide synthesis protein [Escherichia coli]MED8677079.1 capsular polysaccharide synthesis protein [Escherichia coli]HAJ6741533.1 capsular biosynthesis protein [Escherichia coli]HCJ5938163.1 capsular biosynthesis protein [Escherichia coli]